MDAGTLGAILESVRSGTLSVEAALEELRSLPFQDEGFAKLDTHRALRKGFPEVVFCQGKTPEQVAAIVARLADHERNVMATRASEGQYQATREVCPDAVYHPTCQAIVVGRDPRPRQGSVAVLSAGTSDQPIADEAALTAEVMGSRVTRMYDVGVAGLHRVAHRPEVLTSARAIVVAAGMEGALPSVVSGLVRCPVIAVPTSVGYGASFGGLAALLGMLNSCAPGVAVVNIDNGFGAGYLAAVINMSGEQSPD